MKLVNGHGTCNLISRCNVCDQLAVPAFNGKCVACALAEGVGLPAEIVNVPNTFIGKSIQPCKKACTAPGAKE